MLRDLSPSQICLVDPQLFKKKRYGTRINEARGVCDQICFLFIFPETGASPESRMNYNSPPLKREMLRLPKFTNTKPPTQNSFTIVR